MSFCLMFGFAKEAGWSCGFFSLEVEGNQFNLGLC